MSELRDRHPIAGAVQSNHLPVPLLFEEMAARHPHAVALSGACGNWTYAELNAYANQQARYLQENGVACGSLIGLCLDRSPELIATILAILKAGCAFVPIESSYPLERIALMLRDSAAAVILTQSSMASRLPAGNGTRIICLDQATAAIERQRGSNLEVAIGAEDLAYVMYTSGSTGVPKGVMVPHRAIARLVVSATYARFAQDEVFLQLAPVSFDASTFEIWGALLNGARLVLAPHGTPSLENIAATIGRYGVTTMWLTAGLFNLIVEQNIESLKGLRQLLVGGDVLSRTHIQRAATALPGCVLINGYGPTETTTFACCHTITDEDLAQARLPIGRPIECTEVHILDNTLQPVPTGQDGEIFISGDGLAHGYLKRPELTAERFMTLAVNGRQVRVYRTGDLGRRRENGIIEFLGRLDNQVKISGHRVEPGEIESALTALPGVRQAAVAAHATARGDKRLIAYVVARDPLSATTLRAGLEQTLPSFMLPSSIQFVDSLPLNANGKVDRSQFPAPVTEDDTSAATVEPFAASESLIRDIWRKVLRIAQPGLDQNFFDLGGVSLGLIEVHAELERVLGRSVALTALFEFPTIRALGRHLNNDIHPDSMLLAAETRALKQRAAMMQGRLGRAGLRQAQNTGSHLT